MRGTANDPQPIAVVDVEMSLAAPPLPGVRPDGLRVRQALILVRFHTEPLGTLVVEVPADGLDPAVTEAMIRSRYGPELAARQTSAAQSGYLAGRAAALAAAPPITVVICTRDRPEGLARVVESVLAQAYPAVRVLVVDSASADGHTRRMARAAGVDYLRLDRPGLALARNAAVEAAPKQTLAWLDDDEVVDGHWLAEIARGLVEAPAADVICGAVVPAELETTAQQWFEQLGGMVKGRGFAAATFSPANRRDFHPLFPLPPVGAGANMVTRPGVVERVGGFDPALGAGTLARGGEDTLFFAEVLRSGGSISYRPTIVTRHFHRRSAAELQDQLRGYGTGLTAMYAALVRRQPSAALSLAALAPRAVRQVLRPSPASEAALGPSVTPRLRVAIRRGMLGGPLAYARAVRALHSAGAP